jgi:hypothetical protein
MCTLIAIARSSARRSLNSHENYTNKLDPTLVTEALAYPSSNFGNASRLAFTPDIDVMVEVELVRLLESGRYSVTLFALLVKLPYKLDPACTDADGLRQLLSCREFSHCHARSGSPLSPLLNKCGYLGGGKGGGGGVSLELGIDIGLAELVGVHLEVKLLDLLDDRYGSEGLEP